MMLDGSLEMPALYKGSSVNACCSGVLSVTVMITAANVHCVLAIFLVLNQVFSHITLINPHRKCYRSCSDSYFSE